VTLVVTVLALAGATGCESIDLERDQVIGLVNDARSDAALPPLRHNVTLDIKADGWARKLRDACSLSHSRLQDGAPKDWQSLGENVGFGGTIADVQAGYLNSAGHRKNMLDPRFTQMGAAAVWGMCDGQRRVFTVQVFMRSLTDR